ncbi:tripartite tricarboxylate transporter TctB family protein [Microvirga sp. GCM10011540]|uniref:tripartite tricarboxylate transporter TctB family protein n=1 Tax=Microvirga sp. GCM10011540 TaxID=3317338 RepID=UPI00361DCA05
MTDQLTSRSMREGGRTGARSQVDRSDLLSGVFFIFVGVLGLVVSRDYDVGTATNMGEGYVPRMICWILIGIGGIIAGRSFLRSATTEVEPLVWRPIICVLASVISFALSVEKLGLLIAIPLMIGIGSLAGQGLRWTETFLIMIGLCLGTIAIFSWGLGLTIPVLPRL